MILESCRQKIRDACQRVDGVYMVPLDVLRPIYDRLEQEAAMAIRVREAEAVVRIEHGAEVTYRIDQTKARELWVAMYGEDADGDEGTAGPLRCAGKAHPGGDPDGARVGAEESAVGNDRVHQGALQ